jgi:hypothetical protein
MGHRPTAQAANLTFAEANGTPVQMIEDHYHRSD